MQLIAIPKQSSGVSCTYHFMQRFEFKFTVKLYLVFSVLWCLKTTDEKHKEYMRKVVNEWA